MKDHVVSPYTSVAIETQLTENGVLVSSLGISSKGIRVIGDLKSGDVFHPASVKDALALANWCKWYAQELSK